MILSEIVAQPVIYFKLSVKYRRNSSVGISAGDCLRRSVSPSEIVAQPVIFFKLSVKYRRNSSVGISAGDCLRRSVSPSKIMAQLVIVFKLSVKYQRHVSVGSSAGDCLIRSVSASKIVAQPRNLFPTLCEIPTALFRRKTPSVKQSKFMRLLRQFSSILLHT